MVRGDTPAGSQWTDEQLELIDDTRGQLAECRDLLGTTIYQLDHLEIAASADTIQRFMDSFMRASDNMKLVIQLEGERR